MNFLPYDCTIATGDDYLLLIEYLSKRNYKDAIELSNKILFGLRIFDGDKYIERYASIQDYNEPHIICKNTTLNIWEENPYDNSEFPNMGKAYYLMQKLRVGDIYKFPVKGDYYQLDYLNDIYQDTDYPADYVAFVRIIIVDGDESINLDTISVEVKKICVVGIMKY